MLLTVVLNLLKTAIHDAYNTQDKDKAIFSAWLTCNLRTHTVESTQTHTHRYTHSHIDTQ